MPGTVTQLQQIRSKAVVEHQPRERSVPCQGCMATQTFNDHAVCNRCIAVGRLQTSCQCAEGLAATDASSARASSFA